MTHKQFFILTIFVFASVSIFAQTKPWENPNSGFTNTSGTGGYDRIDKVITTNGATKQDGKTVSNSGSSKDKSFVEGFLNGVASKLTGANGSANAWSWTKKWTVGPDGKPTEVVETYHEGSLKLNGVNNPKPTGSSSGSAPSTAGSAPSGNSSGGSPAVVSAPSSKGGSSSGPGGSGKGGSPGTSKTASSPTGGPGGGGATTPGSTKPNGDGPNIAPPKVDNKLPPKMVTLVLEDQMTGQAQPFVSIEKGFSTVAKPIPEDVRALVSLELGNGMNKEDVSVKLQNDEGEDKFPNGTFPAPYVHIFRQPADDKYFASVIYTDPSTGKSEEKLHVVIPVYKVNVKNRAIESDQHRMMEANAIAAPNYSASTGSSGKPSSGGGSFGGGSFGPTSGNSVAADSDVPDLSDLYKDPSLTAGKSGGSSVDTGANGGASDGSSSPSDSAGAGASATSGLSGSGSETPAEPTEVAAEPVTEPQENADPTKKPLKTGGKGKGKAPVQMASAKGVKSGGGGSSSGSSGSNGSTLLSVSDSSGKTPGKNGGVETVTVETAALVHDSSSGSEDGVASASVNTADKDFLVSITMFNSTANINQSFDFSDHPYRTASKIRTGTSLSFSLDLGKKVNRDSVKVVVFDGKEKNEIALSSLKSDVFDGNFTKPGDESYVWVYGDANDKPFSVKLAIPVDGM